MTLGRLYLVPNTLDFGMDGQTVDLREVLPDAVIAQAARLTHWAAENAKTTRAFLKRVDGVHPLALPLQQQQILELPRPPKGRTPAPSASDDAAWQALLAPALQGTDVGLMSEAGMPAVADPGARLVAAAHAAGVPVIPLVGPSSLLLAVAASGMNGQSFAFVGYLPTDGAARQARLKELEAHSAREQQTQLMIETPYRNSALLQALIQQLKPGTVLSVSCGLSLADAWTHSAPVSQWKKSPKSVPDKVPAVFAFLAGR
ncbi:SAM-dependent methyltransferase [Roseateles depolymerans]|uniref:Putative transmembrane protein n=1 Tax=Roseateles depolymerans TaxID=76731 RepID=A0A0U3LK52_9BURK|nr:SAM-dependent methyltransferase [Roseateles depolymerans]ALV08479.1 Putative transmembrane protein [Roseateles depolymerans]REG21295.1 16S rRNA (cytidine1402-2'-O)-methyltransferase [Roseateles depolymerans]